MLSKLCIRSQKFNIHENVSQTCPNIAKLTKSVTSVKAEKGDVRSSCTEVLSNNYLLQLKKQCEAANTALH